MATTGSSVPSGTGSAAPLTPSRKSLGGAGGGNSNECIQVVVRCRPFNTKEKTEGRGNIVQMDTTCGQVSLRPHGEEGSSMTTTEYKSFTFDGCYDETTVQRAFYEESCYPLVESVIEGYNATIFAYGQTGCGKTFTMMGMAHPPELRGVIPNSFDHIFETIRVCTTTAAAAAATEGGDASTSTTQQQFLVRCSFLEIYQEEIRDLLASDPKQKRELKEDPQRGVTVKDLTDVIVQDEASLLKVMEKGVAHRTVGATLMNEGSSRSHSIFTITIETSREATSSEGGQAHFKVGKLNLVDLAGSERQSKTGATGDRLKEGSKINLSLSALGNVISALADAGGKVGSKHIPYRDSKLTRLLQDSLGGNTKTLMVAAISPADYNYDETLSTLRYANRAKNIKNKPKINEDPKDAVLREYKEEIEKLRAMLQAASTSSLMNEAAGERGEEERKKMIVEVIKEVEKEKIVEVESKELLEQKAALESMNASLLTDHAKLGHDLQEERAARGALEKLLASLQSRIIGEPTMTTMEDGGAGGEGVGEGDGGDEESAEEAKKKAEERRLNQKLKAKRKKELLLEAERKKAIEEKQQGDVEGELKIIQQDLSETTNEKLAKYKARMERKIREAKAELEDSLQEFERERETYLETIRQANRELKLWEQVSALFFSTKTINKIWDKATWDESLEEWRLPKLESKELLLSGGSTGTQQKLPTIKGGGKSAPTTPVNKKRSPLDDDAAADGDYEDGGYNDDIAIDDNRRRSSGGGGGGGQERKGSSSSALQTPPRTPPIRREGSTGSSSNSKTSSSSSMMMGEGSSTSAAIREARSSEQDNFCYNSNNNSNNNSSSKFASSSLTNKGMDRSPRLTQQPALSPSSSSYLANNKSPGRGVLLEHIDPLEMSKRLSSVFAASKATTTTDPRAAALSLLQNNDDEDNEEGDGNNNSSFGGGMAMGAMKPPFKSFVGGAAPLPERGSAGRLPAGLSESSTKGGGNGNRLSDPGIISSSNASHSLLAPLLSPSNGLLNRRSLE